MQNSSSPRFSVLMPVCNGRAYLVAAIESVLAQTLTDFEFLICDDRSDDDSMAIIERYPDPRIRVLANSTRQGLFTNVNILLAQARGRYLRVLCQDDILYPTALADESDFLAAHPEVGMVMSKSKTLAADGSLLGQARLDDLPAVLPTPLAMQHYFYHGCIPGNLSNVAFPRATLEKVGVFDPAYSVSGDYEMWVRICEAYPMGLLQKHVVGVRFHVNQLSRKKSSGVRFVRENRLIRQRAWKSLPTQVKSKARHYERIRHGTLEFHWALRSLLAGRAGDFLAFCRILNPRELAISIFYWFVTLNNRIYHPQAYWILP